VESTAYLGFEVLTAVSTKMTVFWVVVPDYTALQPRRQPSFYSQFVGRVVGVGTETEVCVCGFMIDVVIPQESLHDGLEYLRATFRQNSYSNHQIQQVLSSPESSQRNL
jgi:hypothetical protein